MKIIVALCFFLVSSVSSAEIYKCADPAGKAVFSDIPCIGGKKINSTPSSGGFTAAKVRDDIPDSALQSDTPAECKFEYYTFRDEKGKVLAENAKKECMRNITYKKMGRPEKGSLSDYQFWLDHRQVNKRQRNAAAPQGQTLHCRSDFIGGAVCN